MRELTYAEMRQVTGGSDPFSGQVDLNGDGIFDTTGTVDNGVLTTADGTQFDNYVVVNPEYQFGAFYAQDAGDWRNSNAEALNYDLWRADNRESEAEFGQDVIKFTEMITDTLDPRTWLDLILGNSAESAEKEQERLREKLKDQLKNEESAEEKK